MKETDLQSKACVAIREMGGFAQKTSNRFLIGVPDILCQLPKYSASFWEVKYSPHAKWMCPDLTFNQKIWLRDFTRAGGFGGVVYFCKDINDMTVAIKPSTFFDLNDVHKKWRIPEFEFVVVPRGSKMGPFKELLEKVHARGI